MENTPELRYLWSTIKPLLQGKVLYTPDTPAARLLVKEVRPRQGTKCNRNAPRPLMRFKVTEYAALMGEVSEG